MSEFHFLRPLWLLALIPATWLLITLWRRQSTHSAWNAVFDQPLLTPLWLESPGHTSRLPLWLLAAGWFLTIVILAGPVWERQPETVWHSQMSRVVILDLSPTMNARDISPSRLERARFKIMDILERSREGRTGLVVFSGEPHIVTPLTEDTATIKNLLTALSTDIMPEQGNAATPALRMAGDLLDLKGIRQGELLLITDGIDDPAAALSHARELREQGYSLSVLGIGTEHGGAIMHEGTTEVVRFNATPLQELARAGGGAFSLLTGDDQDLNRLLPEKGASGSFERMENDTGRIDRWVEYGVWLLPVVVLLAAAAFRRGWLIGIIGFTFISMTPPPVYADGWQDLWLRADQQAQDRLQQGDASTAAQLFEDPEWRGMALYESGDFEAAAQAFAQSDNLEARYNQGNAWARAGELQQAIDAYRDVLQQNPAHEDARANLELLEQLSQDQLEDEDTAQENEDKSEQQNEENEDNNRSEDTADSVDESTGENAESPKDKQDDPDTRSGNAQQPPENAGHDEQPDDPSTSQPTDEQKLPQDEQSDIRRDAPPPQDITEEDTPLPSEEDIALKQWLRQIPEDPSGLLRRKFMLEHLQRKEAQ